MSIKKKQAEAYLEEAKLSIKSAEASLKEAKEGGSDLWHSVVKSSYDAMEQAVSALLAMKGLDIPKTHPGKVEKFVNEFGESEITERIYNWLGRRSKSQYVDIEGDEIIVPHELFDKIDAEESLKDARFVVERIEERLD